METISGIPSHPLFVHIPVVLLPLAAILAIVMLIKQQWFDRYRWLLLGVVGVGALGAILAASSGEELEESLERTEGVSRALEEHAEAGEMARNVGILFFIVVVAWIAIPILLKRRAGSSAGTDPSASATPRWFRPVVAAFVLLCAAGSVVTVIDAGHSGAKQVWNEEGDEGGEGEGDEDGAPALIAPVDQVITVAPAGG